MTLRIFLKISSRLNLTNKIQTRRYLNRYTKVISRKPKPFTSFRARIFSKTQEMSQGDRKKTENSIWKKLMRLYNMSGNETLFFTSFFPSLIGFISVRPPEAWNETYLRVEREEDLEEERKGVIKKYAYAYFVIIPSFFTWMSTRHAPELFASRTLLQFSSSSVVLCVHTHGQSDVYTFVGNVAIESPGDKSHRVCRTA